MLCYFYIYVMNIVFRTEKQIFFSHKHRALCIFLGHQFAYFSTKQYKLTKAVIYTWNENFISISGRACVCFKYIGTVQFNHQMCSVHSEQIVAYREYFIEFYIFTAGFVLLLCSISFYFLKQKRTQSLRMRP